MASTRPFRFEVLAISAIAAVTIVFAGAVVLRLMAYGIPRECFVGGPTCAPFEAAITEYQANVTGWTGIATTVCTILPALAAMLVGIAIVGKEIDQRTTVLAWSLAPSRSRWLLQRLLVLGLLLAAYCLVAGGLANVLMGLARPVVDQEHNFEGLGARGLPIVGTGVMVLGLMLLVGAILGRILPSILVGGTFVVCASILVSFGHDALLRSEAVVVESFNVEEGSRSFDGLLRTPEGELISWEQAYQRYGPELDQLLGDPYVEGSTSGFAQMTSLVHAAEYPPSISARRADAIAWASWSSSADVPDGR